MEVNIGAPELLRFPHSSEYFPLCSAEQRKNFGNSPLILKILSFTHPHVVPELYKFLTSAAHKRGYFEESW